MIQSQFPDGVKVVKANHKLQGVTKTQLIFRPALGHILPSTAVAIVAILALGFSSRLNAQAQAPASGSKDVDANYLIGPSDMLAISVWKDAELSKTLPVRPDGKISLPLINEIEVSGLTAKAVQDIITQKLKDYISDPQVTVIVQEVRSRTYSILGKVAKQGSFPLGKPIKVLEAIAIAGGFTDFAQQTKIYIMRPKSDGSTQTIPFNYKKAIKPHDPAEDIELQNGDTIIVP